MEKQSDAQTSAALGGASDSALPRVENIGHDADQTDAAAVPRRRTLRRSSMTGRVTGMRRGSMASQISQTSVSSGMGADVGGESSNRPRRRTRRRNSMLSTASHESARSRASHNIDKLAAEIRDLQECREHELALAEEEMRRLRLEREQSQESAAMLEDLIETASMADGGFDIDAALRRHEQQQQGGSSGTLSVGELSIPVDLMIEGDLRGEDSGKISAATFDSMDQLVAYEEPVKDEDAVHTSTTRRGRRRASRARSSSASDDDGSVCSVERLDYANNKIERIQQARRSRRSRSMSVDRVGMGGNRKPRRGRRLTRSSSRDTGGDTGSGASGGERRIRSRSLDVGGGGHRPRHLRKRPANNSKAMRKLEVAAIADLQKQIKERKDEIEQLRNRMEMRVESAEENATMMDEIATMQVKTIADLKVEILKTKAALRFHAVRRHDSDAIAAERKSDPEYRQRLTEREESLQLLQDLRGRIDDIEEEESQSNAKQAELLRQIPKVRAEGATADMKRMIEENRVIEKIEKEELKSRIASMKSRIAKCNSHRASKAIVEGKYGIIESTQNSDELHKAFVSAHSEIQQMRESLTADIELIKSLPELKSRPKDIVEESSDIALLAEDATATIELLGAEWAEQYVYLRMIRGRDEEIDGHEKHVNLLNEEAKRLRRLLTQKKKDAIQAKRKGTQRIEIGGSGDSKTASVST